MSAFGGDVPPLAGCRYFARPDAYRDGVLVIPSGTELERQLPSHMPPDDIQLDCLDI